MITIWSYSLISVLIVSLLSFAGVLVLIFKFKEEILSKVLFYLVSFSAGAILGDVFLHLVPEVIEK